MQRPTYITQQARDSMNWKEQDLVVLLREKKRTKQQIKRKLYIYSDRTYYRIIKNVSSKIRVPYCQKDEKAVWQSQE